MCLAVLGLCCSMWTLSWGMWDLVPWPVVEPGSPALEAQSLSHWTTKEVPQIHSSIVSLLPLGGKPHKVRDFICPVHPLCTLVPTVLRHTMGTYYIFVEWVNEWTVFWIGPLLYISIASIWYQLHHLSSGPAHEYLHWSSCIQLHPIQSILNKATRVSL